MNDFGEDDKQSSSVSEHSESLQHIIQQQGALNRSLMLQQQQLEDLAKRQWQVQEEERRRIAIDLHDGVGQLITVMINKLKLANQDQETSLEVHELLSLSNAALHEVRSLSKQLRPRILDELGLNAAIQWLARTLKDAVGCHVTCQYNVNEELPQSIQTLLFRITQESFQNIIKHASASSVTLMIQMEKSRIDWSVQDDGCGFSQSKTFSHSIGLVGIQDRLSLYGALLDIKSSQGNGCCLSSSIIIARDIS